jgi:hypothetical protein
VERETGEGAKERREGNGNMGWGLIECLSSLEAFMCLVELAGETVTTCEVNQ